MSIIYENNELKMQADIYLNDAQEYVSNNELDKAIDNVSKALEIFHNIGNSQSYIINLNLLGIIYGLAKDDEKSFECYLEAMAMAELLKFNHLKALCYTNVGGCYLKMGKCKKAFQYFRDAQKVLEDPSIRAKCPVLSMVNYVNLRDSYEDNQDNEELLDVGYTNIYDDKSLVFV